MTQSKHTLGPWKFRNEKSRPVTRIYANGDAIASALRPKREVLEGFHIPEQEVIANARLIAAAPDLLEALERCVSVLSMHDTPHIYNQAKEAIAKARGEHDQKN